MKPRAFPPSIRSLAAILPACLLGITSPISSAGETRELTNLQGVKIQADVQELTAEGTLKVKIKGKPFDIPLDQLSEADREWARSWDEARKASAEGDEYSKAIFSDDFSKDGFGEAWGHYKSGSIVKDGILQGITPPGSDHAAVDSVKIDPIRDIEVSVKFRFAGPAGRRLDIWLDDKDFKGAHAGHVCRVSLSPNDLSIIDAKEGSFRKDIYEKKKAGEELDKETLKLLETTAARFETKIKDDGWHTLTVRTSGDEAVALVDGKKIGSLKSPGIAHETKTLVSLTTNQADIHYDDFAIRAKRASSKKP